jgi:hypothetical protein
MTQFVKFKAYKTKKKVQQKLKNFLVNLAKAVCGKRGSDLGTGGFCFPFYKN